jgi:hypothetical protein
MVRPMVASAEPSAKFMAVCKRLTRAARSEASPSGISTTAAITIPTTAFGAPSAAIPSSTAGVSALAKPTTATREIGPRSQGGFRSRRQTI